MIRSTMLTIFVLTLATAALADHVWTLEGLHGIYPPERTIEVQFPEDMFSVSHISAEATYTGELGEYIDDEGHIREHAMGFSLILEVEHGGEIVHTGVFFLGAFPEGYEMSGVQIFYIEEMGAFEGETVTVRVFPNQVSGFTVIEPASLEILDLQLRLLGNVVETEPTSFSAVKRLFE